MDEFYEIKQYLYEENPIGFDFRTALETLPRDTITFLCGSSGDGKSEILTRCAEQYKDIDIHLDATHSLSQHTSAVESLNNAFSKHKIEKSKMAVGINIGMMQKFIKYGSDEHDEIKSCMRSFFDNRHIKGYSIGKLQFYDFECYPRLSFSNNKISSEFAVGFINKLTSQNNNNPFWLAFQKEDLDSQLHKNFSMLSNEAFKNSLVKLFGLAKLYKEQFLTPRTLIDYIYQILTFKNNPIYNNVFSLFDNDLSKKIHQFDPACNGSGNVDDFIMRFSLNLLDHDIKNEIKNLKRCYGGVNTPNEVIRLFYFIHSEMKDSKISKVLDHIYDDEVLSNYLELYNLTQFEKLSNEQMDRFEDIVYSIIIKGIRLFSNRTCPKFNDDYLLFRHINSCYIGVKTHIEIDFETVYQDIKHQNDEVSFGLIINDTESFDLKIDINIFELLTKIVNGYYPNIQRKSNVLMLEDIVDKILGKASNSKKLAILTKTDFYTVENKERKYVVEPQA
jgi:DNA phosphorothioation-dependent restriction protein DptF